MLIVLLWACGGEAPPTAPTPSSSSSSSATDALLGALPDEGSAPVTSQPSADRAVPDGNTPTPEVTVTERSTSPACQAAEQAYDAEEAQINDYRARVIVGVEDRMMRTGEAISTCLMDPACQAEKERFGQISRNHEDAKAAYERAYDRLPEMEAALFPLREEMLAACGGNRQ